VSYSNGNVDRLVEGVSATFTCDPGFALTGDSGSLCNGEVIGDVLDRVDWNSEIPKCERKSILCNVCSHDSIFLCIIAECPMLIANETLGISSIAILNDSRIVNAVAQYRCLRGYLAVTSLFRRCELIGEELVWSAPEPICIGKSFQLQ